MSKGSVNQVIQRAIGDAAFRRQLTSDPNKALAGFDLTKDERAAITGGDAGRLTALGVDQRMSKAFSLSGMGDASKSSVSPDVTGATASTLIDEGSAAATSSIVTGGSTVHATNLRRIEGDLNTGAAVTTEGASVNATNLRRIEGDLNTAPARDAVDVSGDFNAFDPGLVSNTSAAAVEGGASVNATNLRRIEGDLNTASAFEPQDASGDFNTLDAGYAGGESPARAADPQIDSAHIPSSGTDASGNAITE